MDTQLTDKEKSRLFWASFLSLMAAGFGFSFRVMLPSVWGAEFQLTGEQVGSITGAALWPIAITMILFSFLVDKIGYKPSMLMAFALQAASVVLTFAAKDANALWWACFCAGLGHGIVEACINPLCASIYRDQKSKMLNILHASWPAGVALGGTIFLCAEDHLSWRIIFFTMLLPVIAYAIMFIMCKHFPVDERVEANVSTKDMLKEFGGLGAFLATTFISYEIISQLGNAKLLSVNTWALSQLSVSAIIGSIAGIIIGGILKSPGKILFFLLCVIMIPLATAELATDNWIRTLMEPILGAKGAGWALVASAAIMMALRFFAGVPLKFMSPPALLTVSAVFSIIGLYLLSNSVGITIFIAFAIYAVGQTFYWPTVLGFVAEQFPKGGALTLNTVSAMGLLTVGIFGFPFLGAVKDSYDAKAVIAEQPALYAQATEINVPDKDDKIAGEANFFSVKYNTVNLAAFHEFANLEKKEAEALKSATDTSARKTLLVAAILPAIMAVSFLLMLLYYKSRGGYKPVVLESSWE